MPGGLGCKEGDNSKKKVGTAAVEHRFLASLGAGLVCAGNSSKGLSKGVA